MSENTTLTFDYDYDEEALGFPEPPMNPGSGHSAGPAGGHRRHLARHPRSRPRPHQSGMARRVGRGDDLRHDRRRHRPLGMAQPSRVGARHQARRHLLQGGPPHAARSGGGMGIFITGFYVAWYWYDSILHNAIRLTDPVSQALRGSPSDKWFFYGFLYTVAVLSFGIRMFHEVSAQPLPARSYVLGHVLPARARVSHPPTRLRALNHPEFYFSYFWPLQYKALFPGEVTSLLEHPGGLGTFPRVVGHHHQLRRRTRTHLLRGQALVLFLGVRLWGDSPRPWAIPIASSPINRPKRGGSSGG